MTVRVKSLTFDCNDARKVASFWSAMTGWHLFYDADPEIMVAPHFPAGDAPMMLFIPVPEGKTAKNRIHFDLQPTDATRDAQVERALDLGATIVDDRRNSDDGGWVVMADPEGNEFCVERSASERSDTGRQTIRLEVESA